MKLKAGLVVDRVKPKSPADLAGLKPLDVVAKLDDQWLINPDQLLGLLRMRFPATRSALTIFHKGDQQTLSVKLDEQDVPVADDESQIDLPGCNFDRPTSGQNQVGPEYKWFWGRAEDHKNSPRQSRLGRCEWRRGV